MGVFCRNTQWWPACALISACGEILPWDSLLKLGSSVLASHPTLAAN